MNQPFPSGFPSSFPGAPGAPAAQFGQAPAPQQPAFAPQQPAFQQPAAAPYGAPAPGPQFGGAPAAPQPPAFQAPAPQQPAAPRVAYWTIHNGAAVEVQEAQARTLPPTAPLCTQDLTTGAYGQWATVGQLLGQAQQATPPAPQQPAFQAPPAQPGFAPQQQQQAPYGQQPGFAPQQPQRPAGSAYPAPAGSVPAGIPQGLFSGAANATASRNGVSLEEGDYIARYLGAEFKQGQGTNINKAWVIHEVEIVQSSFNPQNPQTAKCNQVGSHVSIFVTRNQSFDGNMKEIALSLMPFDAQGQRRQDNSPIPEHEMGAMLQDPCPVGGRYVFLTARKKATRPKPGQTEPGEFTRISWKHMPTGADGQPDVAAFTRDGWA